MSVLYQTILENLKLDHKLIEGVLNEESSAGNYCSANPINRFCSTTMTILVDGGSH